MNQKKQTSEAAVREIRRRTRRKFSPEEKIRIVLEGLRGESMASGAATDAQLIVLVRAVVRNGTTRASPDPPVSIEVARVAGDPRARQDIDSPAAVLIGRVVRDLRSFARVDAFGSVARGGVA